MNLTYVPLLRTQRELYETPRGFERFREYIAAMVDPETKDLKVPLVSMNPMGREHVPALLDRYLAMDADGIAGAATSEAAGHLEDVPGTFRVVTVLADDLKGGWTNRHAVEF